MANYQKKPKKSIQKLGTTKIWIFPDFGKKKNEIPGFAILKNHPKKRLKNEEIAYLWHYLVLIFGNMRKSRIKNRKFEKGSFLENLQNRAPAKR